MSTKETRIPYGYPVYPNEFIHAPSEPAGFPLMEITAEAVGAIDEYLDSLEDDDEDVVRRRGYRIDLNEPDYAGVVDNQAVVRTRFYDWPADEQGVAFFRFRITRQHFTDGRYTHDHRVRLSWETHLANGRTFVDGIGQVFSVERNDYGADWTMLAEHILGDDYRLEIGESQCWKGRYFADLDTEPWNEDIYRDDGQHVILNNRMEGEAFIEAVSAALRHRGPARAVCPGGETGAELMAVGRNMAYSRRYESAAHDAEEMAAGNPDW